MPISGLIYFKDVSDLKSLCRSKVSFTAMVLDVPNMVWALASADISAFVDGPRECLDRVYGYERPSVAVKLL